MTNLQWPILNCIFLFSLLLALPLLSAAQTNSPAPPQPSQPMTSPSNPAPAAPAEEANIKFDWSMPVAEVLDDIYAPLVRRTWLRGAPALGLDNPGVLITLKTMHDLTRSEAIKAVEDEMSKKGFTIVPIGEKYFKVLYKGDEWPDGRRLSSNAPGTMPTGGKFTTKVVHLKYADPDEVVKALSSVSKTPNSVIYIPSTESLILRDYTDNVKRMRMLDMVEKLDVEPAQTIKSEVIPIRRALAKDIAARIPHFAQTKLIADERTNSLLVFANDADMKMIKQLIWQAENSQDIR